MSGGHMLGKYNSYHQRRDTANCNQKGIKRENECTTTASNYRQKLLNVSVMLQCIANTTWSQVTLSARQGKRRWRAREDEGEAFKQLRCPTVKSSATNSQLDKAIFTIPVRAHNTSQN